LEYFIIGDYNTTVTNVSTPTIPQNYTILANTTLNLYPQDFFSGPFVNITGYSSPILTPLPFVLTPPIESFVSAYLVENAFSIGNFDLLIQVSNGTIFIYGCSVASGELLCFSAS
jgi:hypothetical protein